MYSTESQDRKRKYLEITMHLALGEESSYSNQLLGYHRKITGRERERGRELKESVFYHEQTEVVCWWLHDVDVIVTAAAAL